MNRKLFLIVVSIAVVLLGTLAVSARSVFDPTWPTPTTWYNVGNSVLCPICSSELGFDVYEHRFVAQDPKSRCITMYWYVDTNNNGSLEFGVDKIRHQTTVSCPNVVTKPFQRR